MCVRRLYSDYYHEYGNIVKYPGVGPDHFHELVTAGVRRYQQCFRQRTVRSCVYDPDLYLDTSFTPKNAQVQCCFVQYI